MIDIELSVGFIHETVYYDDKSQGHESGLLLYTVISKH